MENNIEIKDLEVGQSYYVINGRWQFKVTSKVADGFRISYYTPSGKSGGILSISNPTHLILKKITDKPTEESRGGVDDISSKYYNRYILDSSIMQDLSDQQKSVILEMCQMIVGDLNKSKT